MTAKLLMMLVFLAALFVVGWGGVKVYHLARREADAERRKLRDETEEFRDAEYSLDRAIQREKGKTKGKDK